MGRTPQQEAPMHQRKNDRGQGVIEYGLIVVLVSLIGLAVLPLLERQSDKLQKQTSDAIAAIS